MWRRERRSRSRSRTTDGFPAPTLAAASALPSGVTFTDNGGGTGTLSGEVPSSDAGSTLTLTFAAVGDPGGTVSRSVDLKVAALSATPPPTVVTKTIPVYDIAGKVHAARPSTFTTQVSLRR